MIIAAAITPPLPGAHAAAPLAPHQHTGPLSTNSGTPDVTHPNDVTTQHVQDFQEANKALPDHVDSFYTRGVNPTLLEHTLPVNPNASAFAASSNADGMSQMASYFEAGKRKNHAPLTSADLLEMQLEMTEITIEYSFYGQIASKASSSIQTLFNNQV